MGFPPGQRGMWAMIACSIALGIWTTILLYWTSRDEKQRVLTTEHESASFQDKKEESPEVHF